MKRTARAYILDTPAVPSGRQEERVRAFAEERGYALAEWVREEGDSSAGRPALTGLVVRLAAGARGGTVLVDSAEVVTGDPLVLPIILHEIWRQGIHLVACDSGADLVKAWGHQISTVSGVIGAFSHLQKERLVRRLSEARASIRGEGRRCDGRKPFGSREGEREALEVILAERARGRTLSQIAAELNNRRIPTRYGRDWDVSFLSRIIRRHGPAQPAPARGRPGN